jgi:hypothetical protein
MFQEKKREKKAMKCKERYFVKEKKKEKNEESIADKT